MREREKEEGREEGRKGGRKGREREVRKERGRVSSMWLESYWRREEREEILIACRKCKKCEGQDK